MQCAKSSFVVVLKELDVNNRKAQRENKDSSNDKEWSSGRIRTCAPCILNATLYQAELRSEILILNAHLKKNKSEEEVIS
jgi:hypothetical protein